MLGRPTCVTEYFGAARIANNVFCRPTSIERGESCDSCDVACVARTYRMLRVLCVNVMVNSEQWHCMSMIVGWTAASVVVIVDWLLIVGR